MRSLLLWATGAPAAGAPVATATEFQSVPKLLPSFLCVVRDTCHVILFFLFVSSMRNVLFLLHQKTADDRMLRQMSSAALGSNSFLISIAAGSADILRQISLKFRSTSKE